MVLPQNSMIRRCWDFLTTPRTHRHIARPSSVNQPEVSPSSPQQLYQEWLARRYQPCKFLSENKVPNVVWFEDALALHGKSTGVSDLYLLVPDMRASANLFIANGYEETEISSRFPDDEIFCRGGIRLKLAEDGPDPEIVLINAEVWNYDLQEKTDLDMAPLPPLSKFLEALMRYWIELPEEEYSEKFAWALSLATLIHCGYSGSRPGGDFVQQLQPELAELHYDLMGGYLKPSPISSYRKHEYHAIRYRQIQKGEFTAQPYPANSFPPSMAEYPDLTGLNAKGVPESKRSKRGRKRRHRKKSKPLEGIDEGDE
ncbi:hypothetical protein VFPPC_10326 [Pochonia chlamydosporia 170]|uniref:Uncharacterized protein n=1 Tax=Pochonia chlamydosporia 170 TaxID=1380566 RepID=A0A179EZJ0_METCM|nr:hypothetical protein VFPPC_10326 [Pochonia chlamydosporia 170]OAQ58614.1 hypothetical protein VFPPC_10326 [Pochonia chlamydosporia 170]